MSLRKDAPYNYYNLFPFDSQFESMAQLFQSSVI